MNMLTSTVIVSVLLASCSRPPEPPKQPPAAERPKSASAYPDTFWKTWQDGKAEVSAYEIVHPRGRATEIVTFAPDRFSNSRRVSADRYRGTDVFPVMTMNAARQYGPGEGEGLGTVSALEPVNGQPAGGTTKVVYSSWSAAGLIWRQAVVSGQRVNLSWHSYRGDEGDGQSTSVYPDAHRVPEDSLPLCARRIGWPILRLGETQSFHVMPSLAARQRTDGRLKLSLTQERYTTVVPAGSFRTHRFTAVWLETGVTKTWDVEADPPHRIIRWQTSTGETGSLLRTARLRDLHSR